MNRPAHTATPTEISLSPADGGWHCSHLYYTWNRAALACLAPEQRAAGRADVISALDPEHQDAPLRVQTSIVSGHKADFGLMLMDPDPLKVDPVATVIDGCVGCGLCGENAHAATLCPSFYRAEIIQNPGLFESLWAGIQTRLVRAMQTA